MAFDKNVFLRKCDTRVSGSSATVYTPKVALAVCEELAALHAKIDALKARLPNPEPARETGWAVRNRRGGGLYTRIAGFDRRSGAINVLWFPDKGAAGVLVGALSYGEPVLLYKDTLEEVAPDA